MMNVITVDIFFFVISTSLIHQFPRYYLTNHAKSLVRNREGIIKGTNCYESFDRRFSCHLFDWELGLIGSFIDYSVELQGIVEIKKKHDCNHHYTSPIA